MTQKTAAPFSGMIYRLEDRPPNGPAILAAIQHILASIVGIVTPALIIGGVLGLGEHIPYLVAMSLFVSGVATFIQCRRFGPVGSGLLSVQGTSFAFVGAILAAGFAVKGRGGTPEDILAMIFGLCLVGCLVEIGLSQFVGRLRRIITPTVTGIVITIIGLSLVKVGFTDFAGGATAGDALGEPINLLLGFIVVAAILVLTFQRNPTVRISAIMAGRSWPSISMVTSLVICMPPAFGVASFSFTRQRTRLPTGTMLVKRTEFEP